MQRVVVSQYDEQGSPVSPTGNVVEIQGHSSLSITDTANYDTGFIDVSSIGGRKNIHVYTTLNQAVSVTIIAYNSQGLYGVGTTSKSVSAAAGGSLVTPSDISLLQEPLQKIKVRVSCSVAPTSGSISTFIEGRTV